MLEVLGANLTFKDISTHDMIDILDYSIPFPHFNSDRKKVATLIKLNQLVNRILPFNIWHALSSIVFNDVDPITHNHFSLLTLNSHDLVNQINKFGNTPLQHFLLGMHYRYTPELASKFKFNPVRIVRAMLSAEKGVDLKKALQNKEMKSGFQNLFKNEEHNAAIHILWGLIIKHHKLFMYEKIEINYPPLYEVIISSTRTGGNAHLALKILWNCTEINTYNVNNCNANEKFTDHHKALLREELHLVCKAICPKKIPEDFRIVDYLRIFSISHQSIIDHMLIKEMDIIKYDKVKYPLYHIIKWAIYGLANSEKNNIDIANQILDKVCESNINSPINFCIHFGATLDYIYSDQHTLLITAAKASAETCMKHILTNKKEDEEYLNFQDKDGRTALIWAAINNFQSGLDILQATKLVRCDIRDNFNKDFYSYQVESGDLNILHAGIKRLQNTMHKEAKNFAQKLWSNKDKHKEDDNEKDKDHGLG